MKARESSWQRKDMEPCLFGGDEGGGMRLMQVLAWPTVFLWLVVVSDYPRVLSMPSRIYLPLGMTGRIDCPVEANPPVTLIQWSKDERLMNQTHVKVNKQGTLIISSVLATDQGQYSCRPYSPLGDGQSSMPIQVIVKGQSHLAASLCVFAYVYTYVCDCMYECIWPMYICLCSTGTIPDLRGLYRLSIKSLG